MDDRFEAVSRDPRFRRWKKKDTKVVIDDRFKTMFNDPDFSEKGKVDKYGRKVGKKEKNNSLKQFYHLEEEEDDEKDEDEKDDEKDEDEDEDEEDDEDDEDEEDEEDDDEDENSISSNDDNEFDFTIKKDGFIDRARGEGLEDDAESSSESSSVEEDSDKDESNEDDSNEDDSQIDSDEEMQDFEDDDFDGKNFSNYDNVLHPKADEATVPEGEETCRLAIVNLDWDHIKAIDIFKVLDSFVQSFDGKGNLRKVTIYPSEFGKERMAQELVQGPPREIFKKPLDYIDENAKRNKLKLINHGKKKKNLKKADDVNPFNEEKFLLDEKKIKSDLIEEDSSKDFDANALRKYQLDRLRYFYAVAEFDGIKTAKHVYSECDGTEFEHSGNFFDLRYIPDEMTFDEQEIHDECRQIKENVFKPKSFETASLQQSNIKLTWEEDDFDRKNVTRRKLTADEIENMDFDAFLASSGASSSEDEGDFETENNNDYSEQKRLLYRSLLAQSDGNVFDDKGLKGTDSEIGNVEITFSTGLTEKASKLIEEKKRTKDETVFEETQRKLKEKKRAKRAKASEFIKEEPLVSDGEDGIDERDLKRQKKDDFKKKDKSLKKDDPSLELLLMATNEDDDTSRNHYNLTSLIENEAKQVSLADKKGGPGRKKSRSKAASDAMAPDTFQIDLNDERFQDIYKNPDFSLDPTNPAFKATRGMKELLTRRAEMRPESRNRLSARKESKSSSDPLDQSDWRNMVNSLKTKSGKKHVLKR